MKLKRLLAAAAALAVIAGTTFVERGLTDSQSVTSYKWHTAQGDTNATLHSVVNYTGEALAAATVGSFFANDSIPDTLAVWISPQMECLGAKAVYFFVRDTALTTTVDLVDSATTAFIQVSNDTINWLTMPLTTATQFAQNDTASVTFIGDYTLDPGFLPTRHGGLGVVATLFSRLVDANTVMGAGEITVIPWKYCRLQLRWTGYGYTASLIRQRRFMRGLRVYVNVIHSEQRFNFRERPSPIPR
jgi:hypothetical protein